MSTHPVFSEDMREIVESFVLETQEIFVDLNNDLLRLEQAEDPSSLIDKIFRAVHTVKGTSGFLNLEQLSILTHHFEDVLNRLRKGELPFHPGMLDVMFAAFDLMNVLLQQILDEQIQPLPLDGLLADLQSLADNGYPEGHLAHPEGAGEKNEKMASPAVQQPAEEEPDIDAIRHAQARRTDNVRVSVERLDHLLSLIGELVLSRNRLARLAGGAGKAANLSETLSELSEASSQIDFITSELQSAVMQTRMVPVGRVLSKFPRAVYDLARELGKKVEVTIEGGETELDKSLVDEIGDPLLHLIRNAVDHGIEFPSERRRHDKPESGRITIRAEHQGDRIVITVEDDGAGIDAEKVRLKAVDRGILTEEAGSSLKRAEVLDLIFRPGFSTAETVNHVSGRGVGMDVVKTIISRMNGSVLVESTPGQGTRFILRLPLTLAIIQSLLIECGTETYALPLHSVREVIALKEVTTIRGRQVVRLRDQILPLIDVGRAFGLSPAQSGRRYAAVVQIDHELYGLVVDDLRGQEEIVIKPLGSFLNRIGGFSGTTILGDGSVVMVLDIASVVEMAIARAGAETTGEAA